MSVNGASFGHKDLFPYERQSNSHERYNKTEIDPMVQIITALGKNLDDGYNYNCGKTPVAKLFNISMEIPNIKMNLKNCCWHQKRTKYRFFHPCVWCHLKLTFSNGSVKIVSLELDIFLRISGMINKMVLSLPCFRLNCFTTQYDKLN